MRGETELSASEVLKVIYAPHKAFREIIQNPKYLGPVLIMALLVVANVGFIYVATSKTYVEQLVPDGSKLDEWTENSTLWTSNAVVSESNDCINGTYYGNRSIAFSIVNSTQVWMQLDGIGSVNCTNPGSFDRVSFRVKQITPNVKPINTTLKLLSANSSGYFRYNLTDDLSNSTIGVWSNLTIQLTSTKWSSSGQANWGDITGFRLEYEWQDDSNVSLLVDGLFFHGVFRSLLDSAGSTYVFNFAVSGIMQFVIIWVLLSGILYIMARGFGGQVVWKALLILIGFTLVTMFVQALINAVAYLTLPTINYPFELIGGVPGEGQSISEAILGQTWLVSEVSRIMQVAMYVWMIALCSLAVRLLAAFSWTKSVLVGAVAYLVTLLIAGFLGF